MHRLVDLRPRQQVTAGQHKLNAKAHAHLSTLMQGSSHPAEGSRRIASAELQERVQTGSAQVDDGDVMAR